MILFGTFQKKHFEKVQVEKVKKMVVQVYWQRGGSGRGSGRIQRYKTCCLAEPRLQQPREEGEQGEDVRRQLPHRRFEKENFPFEKQKLEENERPLFKVQYEIPGGESDIQLLGVQHVVIQAAVQVVEGFVN